MAVVEQRLDDLAGPAGREAPVRGERDHQETRLGAGERCGEIAAVRHGRVEVVQRLGDAQVGVGVEVGRELVALVAQVGLDLELHVEAELELALTQFAAELLGHRVIGQVGDVTQHPRDAQSAARHDAMRVVVAAVEVGVGRDRLPRHFIEGDVLGRQFRCGGDHQRIAHAIGEAKGPLQRLHRAEAAAHHRRELADAQPVGEARVHLHPVVHRHDREVRAPGLARGGIDAGRPGGAMAAAEVVDADDEEPVRVHRLAGADEVVPPADVLGIVLVPARDMVGSVQRMTHEDRVGPLGVQRAVGLVTDGVGRHHRAAHERQRFVELHVLRGDGAHRTVRFAGCTHQVGSSLMARIAWMRRSTCCTASTCISRNSVCASPSFARICVSS